MRIGRIGYINCAPVYGAIDRGVVALPQGAALITGTPAELNDLLRIGVVVHTRVERDWRLLRRMRLGPCVPVP